MKRLLLPLLAVFALPTAVNAESVWLVFMAWNSQYNGGVGGLSQKFPMKSMDQCEKAKIEFIEVLRKNEGGQKVERPLFSGANYRHHTFCFKVPE